MYQNRMERHKLMVAYSDNNSECCLLSVLPMRGIVFPSIQLFASHTVSGVPTISCALFPSGWQYLQLCCKKHLNSLLKDIVFIYLL